MLYPKDLMQKIITLKNNLSKDNIKLQQETLNNVLNPKTLKEIDSDDIEIFNLFEEIYHNGYITPQDKKDLVRLATILHENLSSSSFDSHKAKLFLTYLEDFLDHQKNYLDYTPGAKNKEYIKLTDLFRSKEKTLVIDKAKLTINKDKLAFNNKLIQGTKIKRIKDKNYIEITGDHFSDENTIKNIYSNKRILASSHLFGKTADPYCYIVEAGKLQNITDENKLKEILGAKNAKSSITIKILVPIEIVWIRVKRNFPAKFAIESNNLSISAPKPQKGFRVTINNQTEYRAA